jgi:hypothetical protein
MKHRILLAVLVIVIAAIVGPVLLRSYVPLLLIGFLAFLAVRYGPWRRRR